MLLEMCHSIDFLNDWLESMVMAVQHANVADGDNSPNILDNQREILQLIYSTKGALQQSATAAAKGNLDAATEERLGFWLTELADAQINAHDAVRERLLHEGSWQHFFSSHIYLGLPWRPVPAVIVRRLQIYCLQWRSLTLPLWQWDPVVVLGRVFWPYLELT